MEVAVSCFGFLVLVIIIFVIVIRQQKKSDRKAIQEKWKDDLIYDPSTGSKLTMEQAQSGLWLAKNEDENRIVDNDELEEYAGIQKTLRLIMNLLVSKGYKKAGFGEGENKMLKQLFSLDKYYEWSCEDVFKNRHGSYLFVISVTYKYRRSKQSESQLMAWAKNPSCSGHYYFTEKTAGDYIYDFVEGQENIGIDGFETHIAKKSTSPMLLNRILEKLSKNIPVEIEVFDENIFLKTLRPMSLEDAELLENNLAQLIS
jgi:hypothetical protein